MTHVPLTIGDMFDRTFRTFVRIFPRALPVALIMIVPPGLLLAAALDMFYTSLGAILPSLMFAIEPDPDLLRTLFWSLLLLSLSGFALLAAMVSVRVAVTALSCADLSGSVMTWQQALGRATGSLFTRALIQVTLEFSVYALLFTGGYGIITFGAAVQASVLVLVGFLALLAGGILVAWWAVRWSQTYAVITCEDVGAVGAFRRSASLVQGSWWRVLGVLLLFGFLKEFVAGLITTPLSLFAFWDFYQSYFALMASPETAVAGPEIFSEMFASLGLGTGLVATVALMLSSLIVPVYLSVLYFDLRARSGEFLPRPRAAKASHGADTTTTLILDHDPFGEQPI